MKGAEKFKIKKYVPNYNLKVIFHFSARILYCKDGYTTMTHFVRKETRDEINLCIAPNPNQMFKSRLLQITADISFGLDFEAVVNILLPFEQR